MLVPPIVLGTFDRPRMWADRSPELAFPCGIRLIMTTNQDRTEDLENTVTSGSGNVYTELGYENSEEIEPIFRIEKVGY